MGWQCQHSLDSKMTRNFYPYAAEGSRNNATETDVIEDECGLPVEYTRSALQAH